MSGKSRLLLEVIGLQTARGRLLFFVILSTLIFVMPYAVLAHLSLWQRLGFDGAPSIGLTRAYWHVLHLHFDLAWTRNPLIFAVLAIGLPLLTVDSYRLIQKWRSRRT